MFRGWTVYSPGFFGQSSGRDGAVIRQTANWRGHLSELPAYAPLLVLAAVVVSFAGVTLGLSYLLGRPRPTPGKSTVYECGVPAVGSARERFPIKFYLVCMIFILLDVDAAFLYPWALIYRELGMFGFLEMLAFMGLLGGGFVYAWKVGALDW
jgi:NADH-quinone oxidoreductase subunit A